MPQLLVRDIPQTLVHKLKRRAAQHGVSAEEEHRRILRDALATKGSENPTLIEFLLDSEVSPGVRLSLDRPGGVESRDLGF